MPRWPARRRFTLADVARGVHDKLVSRHPHVFGDVVADSPEPSSPTGSHQAGREAARERHRRHPPALPALALATKLQRKASAIGVSADGAGDDATQWRALVEALTSIPSSQGLGQHSRRHARGRHNCRPRLRRAAARGRDLGRRRGIGPRRCAREAALRLRDEIVEAEQRGRSESDCRHAPLFAARR